MKHRLKLQFIPIDVTRKLRTLMILSLLMLCLCVTSAGALQIRMQWKTHRQQSNSLPPSATFNTLFPLPSSPLTLGNQHLPPRKQKKKQTGLQLLFTKSSNIGNGAESTISSFLPKIAPWARAAAIFALGYGIGGASAPGWQRHDRLTRNIGFTKIALIILIIRDLWRSTPSWAKPRITMYAKKIANVFRFCLRAEKSEIESEVDDADHIDEIKDVDDITDFSNLAMKLEGVVRVFSLSTF